MTRFSPARTVIFLLMMAFHGAEPGSAQRPASPGESAAKKSPLSPTLAKEIRLLQDLPYAGTNHPRQRLDLLLPASPARKPLPVLLYIHGGAWRQGSKNAGRALLEPWVRQGNFAGVSLGYRLSQDATWPAQIHDCKAAIRWLRAHAEVHGLDPDKIAVWGASAGGHLAALLGVTGDVPSLEGSVGPHLDLPSTVTCVLNDFGPSDLLTMDDEPSALVHNDPDSPESQLIGGPIQEHPEISRQASPLTHVTSGDAPFLHVHGDADPLVPYGQSVRLDRALDRAGVPSILITVASQGHGNFQHPQLSTLRSRFLHTHLLEMDQPVSQQTLTPPANP